VRLAAYFLLGLGVGLSALNWTTLLGMWIKKTYISPVFPVPSVLTAIGLALFDETRAYWWLGLLTDYTFLTSIFAAVRWTLTLRRSRHRLESRCERGE